VIPLLVVGIVALALAHFGMVAIFLASRQRPLRALLATIGGAFCLVDLACCRTPEAHWMCKAQLPVLLAEPGGTAHKVDAPTSFSWEMIPHEVMVGFVAVSLRHVAVAFLAVKLVSLGIATLHAAARRQSRRALLATAGSLVCAVGLGLAISLPFLP
jgi:hypothetical protein